MSEALITRPVKAPATIVMTVLIPFGCGYYLSYLFRTVNAVISPQLVAVYGLTPGDLGLLTAAYFITFASVQIPLGVALDRYGPRRVQAVLLLSAAAGAAVFATAQGFTALLVGRGLIGLGASACLMASFKANALWWPRERLALHNNIIMAFGSFGALSATAPVEALLHVTGWREIFLALGAVTLALSVVIWLVVPERAGGGAAGGGMAEQFAALKIIYRSPEFWRYATPLIVCYAVFMSYQTLWAAPWLRDVAGMGRGAVAAHMFWIQAGMFAGVLLSGYAADRMRHLRNGPEWVLGGVLAAAIALQAVLAAGVVAGAEILWPLWSMFSAATVIAFSLLAQKFPSDMTARVTTNANLIMFVLTFPVQWGVGEVIGLYPVSASGNYDPAGHAVALFIMVVMQGAALLFFAWPRRRARE